MAPARSRPQLDDQRSETPSTKEKNIGSSANSKARRVASTTGGSSLRDVTTPGMGNGADGGNSSNSDSTLTVSDISTVQVTTAKDQ